MENTNQKISTPTAIIVAGLLIMVGILLTKDGVVAPASKTLSEQVGISKDKLSACIKGTDTDTLSKNIDESVNKAMSHIPRERRGTPYSIIIDQNGSKTEVLGAESYENVKRLVDEVQSGKVSKVYAGEVVISEPNDHILGNPNAKVTIIEYSDYECPFCKKFHSTVERIVKESEGTVNWIYRHYPLHQNSIERLIAAECVAQIKGSEAFWKYTDLLFGLLKTTNDSKSELL